jgi:F-actin capping protein, beta subunit
MLDLMRRLPPTKIEDNVELLMQISPDYADDLSSNVDQPLKLRVDRTTGKEYLACVYNQDGESFRCVALRCVARFSLPWLQFYFFSRPVRTAAAAAAAAPRSGWTGEMG